MLYLSASETNIRNKHYTNPLLFVLAYLNQFKMHNGSEKKIKEEEWLF